VRRARHLFERIASFAALSRAARAAARGKKRKGGVARFLLDAEREVLALERELRVGTYRPRPFRTFVVRDPKPRTICAADFRDRVVHHAVCAELEPLFERGFMDGSYACRKGKGAHAAARRAQEILRLFRYYLKLDVRKFFDSVDHGVLKRLLGRRIKDADFLRLLGAIIDQQVPWTEAGKGIPIGNLTSQHFANLYLDPLDHFVKETLRVKGCVRYMDDVVLFADEKGFLWDALAQVERFLRERLLLSVKEGSSVLAPAGEGLSFLGLRIFPGVVRIQRRGWRRFRRKAIERERTFAAGEIDEETFVRSMASLTGHLRHAATRNLRASFFVGRECVNL
jgi:retron-type reverse transcriptase